MRERPRLGRVALAQGFFGGGFIAAGPLFALVNVDRLNLSLADVGVIGVLSAVATTLSFLAWGAAADRTRADRRRCGSAASSVWSGSSPTRWRRASPSSGSPRSRSARAAPRSRSGSPAIVSDETPLAARASAMSGWNAFTGARGLVAPFVASGLVQAGVLSVPAALLLCACVTAIGVTLFWREARRPREEVGILVPVEAAA